VQGDGAADQIIKALKYFNESANQPDVVAILRGGGSRDDLAVFDDELLVRAVAACRVPVIVGVGHETDVTLCDLAADVRASTPSNAAQLITPDKREIAAGLDLRLKHSLDKLENFWENQRSGLADSLDNLRRQTENQLDLASSQYQRLADSLRQLDPKAVLRRGYAIVRDDQGKSLRTVPKLGDNLRLTTSRAELRTAVLEILTKSS
jgi:exodeoxyribonuclease VII large subunit